MTAEKAPGPCYPNWPSTNGAFVTHARSMDGKTCSRCGLPWEKDDDVPTD